MIQIIGAGAIGCLWLAKLQLSGEQCHIVSRSVHLKQTLSFTNQLGETKQLIISHSQQLLNSNIQQQNSVILVCVKAQQVVDALLMYQKHISSSQPLILMHNGYGCADEVIKYFPDNPIIIANTSHASLLHAPFEISHTGSGPTYFGSFNSPATSLSNIISPFKKAVNDVHWSDNIQEKGWLKLAINAIINPLTAVNQIKNGELISNEFADIIEQLIMEVFCIAKAEKIQLDLNLLKRTIEMVIKATAQNFSSMNRDIYYHRETEIMFINGYLIKKAALHNIKVPRLVEYYDKIIKLSPVPK